MKRILLTVFLAGAAACATTEITEPGTVVDIAARDDNFSTLVAALKQAELVQALSADGEFTVFAPTNEAFEALGTTVDALMKPESKDRLIRILTHHVVDGTLMAEQVEGLDYATTLAGTTLDFETADGAVLVGGAKLIKTDILGRNGVIHVVDKVIVPADVP